MRFLLPLLLAALQCAGGAPGNEPCGREPAGSVKAFFPGRQPSRDVTATVERITPLQELGGFRYDIRDAAGEEARLTWIAPEAIDGVRAGETYRFVVDYAPGFPDASGILVYQGDALLFAGLTDQKLFQHVLREGIPGFRFAVGEPLCPSRGSTECHESLVNLPLTVEHAGERRSIHHDGSATVGAFEVRALTVQRVTYSSRCADAGRPAISFTISRNE